MSPSIVTALKVSATASLSSACKAGAAIGASVKTKVSMVAMSGAIMPAPLAMPLIVTVALPRRAVAVATFGKVSVVMMALAASSQPPACALATRPSITPPNWLAGSGSPITPVEARNTSPGLQPAALAASSAVNLQASRPVLPVKALALPELTTSARAAALSLSRHHSTGADGHFERVNTPGDRRALIEQHQQHVGAPGIADAGSGGRQPHARDRGHVGHGFRRERREGCGHWWAYRESGDPSPQPSPHSRRDERKRPYGGEGARMSQRRV